MAAELRFEQLRELLSQTIVESLNSWPDTHRRVFIEAHYGGRSAEEIACAMGLRQSDVIQILQHCERKLYRALKAFRDQGEHDVPQEPPHQLEFVLNSCSY